MKTLSFGIENARIIDERNDSQFAKLEIDMFASGSNKHRLPVSEETLKKTSYSILSKPVTWVYDKLYNDIGGHSPLQVPGGFIPADSEIKFNKMEDGRTMMTVVGLIWKRYSGQLLQLFERDGGSKGVSVEMELFDFDEPTDDKDGEIRDFCYTAITCLGDLLTPAIPMAKATVLSFAEKYNEDYKMEFEKYGKLDFSIPQNIKDASTNGLELATENGGGKSVDLSIAKYLIKKKFVTPDRIKTLYSKLSKFSSDDLVDKTGSKWVAWQLLGGYDGWKWTKELFEQMTTINEEDFMKKDKDGKPIGEEEENDPQATMAEGEAPKEEEMSTEEKPVEEEMSTEEKPAEEEMSTEEKPEEEEMSDDGDEDDEPKEEEMSLDAYLDVGASLAMLQNETEGFKEIVADESFTATELFSLLFEQYKVQSAELEDLKAFKSDVETKEFDFMVNSVLQDIESKSNITEEALEELRVASAEFSNETIDGWKNSAYAKAFTFGVKNSENADDTTVVKIGIAGLYGFAKPKAGLWDEALKNKK